jgi:uncharacterized circularly permuted ATP-grasp superfamily protein/uncharacterized alpha-E superfamily protein
MTASQPGHTATLGPPEPAPGGPWAFDETWARADGVRSHWRAFFEQIDALGLVELRRRWEEAQHLIHEHGITYNVYGDPRGMERPWDLDPIPLLLSEADAAGIASGLTQRARLLDRLLADLYGPQTVLTGGVLPPELVFDHPGYLRPCHGVEVACGRYLHLYAADLGRSPDGSFLVLRDRTQAPSGAGYALENRIVLSRMLPEIFADCRVHRLADFFQTLRESLRRIAPANVDSPRVVLLTPGPYNETYFEHAFLARYLGYTLVEGADLTVRDNRVYLKLLGGLQQVDVILRRLDDDYCDPLELRGDSFLGVPGLVQAVRAGSVAVANALGSGLAETPALLAYLPALCRHLLGEELALPSVPTWWCGAPGALDHVLANLHRLVVKPAYPSDRSGPHFGEVLDDDGRRALAAAIRARPGDYIGQEPLRLSTAPVLDGGQLRSRLLAIRAFLAATGDTYAAMPGGLTRVAATDDTLVVSMQKGGGSKDTWVLSSGPVSTLSLLPSPVQPVELSRAGSDLPSRAADNLYWLGRYAERAEGTVRLLRGILLRLTQKTELGEPPDLPSLLRALTDQTKTFPGFVGRGSQERLHAPAVELFSVLFDEDRPGGLAATLDALHLVAGRVRDRISTDMWRIIVGLNLDPDRPRDARGRARTAPPQANGSPPRRPLSDTLDLLDRMVISLAAFGGMVAEGMTRGQAWRFLDMGKRLERCLHTISLLRSTLIAVVPNEAPLLEALLEIADSTMTYRRRYLSGPQPAPLLDLLLADDDNPRSLSFQLAALTQSIAALPATDSGPGSSPAGLMTGAAGVRIRGADMDDLARLGPDGRRAALDAFLADLEREVPLLSDTLTRTYLTHLQASRQYASRPV